jgi:hypothetical protein
MESMKRLVAETLKAEASRRAADEAQEQADAVRHWNPFPRTVEEKAEAQLKREAWMQAEAIAKGTRRAEQAAAYEAGSRLLRMNRQVRRRLAKR